MPTHKYRRGDRVISKSGKIYQVCELYRSCENGWDDDGTGNPVWNRLSPGYGVMLWRNGDYFGPQRRISEESIVGLDKAKAESRS